LVRQEDGSWCWSDGQPEPRVRDLSPDEWNFRCRSGNGQCYVEVLRGVAQESEALAWVIAGARAGKYRSGKSGDHTGPVIIDDNGVARRMHIQPGENPLLGHEPLPESPGPIPAVILVPVAEWDEWVRTHPAGAEWDVAHETSILDRAYALGWRPAHRYVARDTGRVFEARNAVP
jgi:hypothetical protein